MRERLYHGEDGIEGNLCPLYVTHPPLKSYFSLELPFPSSFISPLFARCQSRGTAFHDAKERLLESRLIKVHPRTETSNDTSSTLDVTHLLSGLPPFCGSPVGEAIQLSFC